MKNEHLLIDGRNCLYRSVFVSRGSSVHPATVFVRFICSYLNKFSVRKLHLFWEGSREDLWRRQELASYKSNRHQQHDFDVEGTVKKAQVASMELMQWCGCRQYCRESMEADDLIFAFCRSQVNERTIIVSNDSDFAQIPFLFNWVSVFDPMKGEFMKPVFDTVEKKCFCGDRTDVVPGYPGIGDKKSLKLISDHKHQIEFIREHGAEIYLRNRKLIDLSCCPYIGENVLYVRSVLASSNKPIDEAKMLETINRRKILGLRGEFQRSLASFKTINGDTWVKEK